MAIGSVDVDLRGIAEGARRRSRKAAERTVLRPAAAGLASGAVRHFDLRIAEPDRGTGLASTTSLDAQAIELRLTIDALRCS